MDEDERDEVGHLRVGDFIDGRGEVRGRSLGQITGQQLPPGDTPMVQKCVAAWNTPVSDLTWEQVRLLLGQGLGIPWTSSMALQLLRRSSNVMVTLFPGDLARQVLRHFPEIYAADRQAATTFLEGDFTWMEAQAEIDRTFGTTLVEEEREALARARQLALKS